MGLPQEIADLVILIFAEQTNRSVILGGRAADVSVLQSLPADAPVVEQPLPGEEEWTAARERGQAIFGIGDISELRTARNISLLADRVRAAAANRMPAARQLRDLLLQKGPAVLGPNGRSGQYRPAHIADKALRLCENLAASTDDVPLIDLLATFALPAVPLHVGKSLATAPDVVHAAERVDWPIFVSVAAWRPGHHLEPQARSLAEQLAQAWAANEYVTPLQPALAAADSAARQSAGGGGPADPAGQLPPPQPDARHVVPDGRKPIEFPAAQVTETGDRRYRLRKLWAT